jgi:hypothetical protein
MTRCVNIRFIELRIIYQTNVLLKDQNVCILRDASVTTNITRSTV